MALIERLPHVEGVIVTAENQVLVSSGLKDRLQIVLGPTDGGPETCGEKPEPSNSALRSSNLEPNVNTHREARTVKRELLIVQRFKVSAWVV